MFEAIHGKGDGGSAGDGIQAILVTYLVGNRDGIDIADPAIGAHGAEGFIFRTAIERVEVNIFIFGFHHTLAAHHTGITGVILLQDGLRHVFPGDILGLHQSATGIVAGG